MTCLGLGLVVTLMATALAARWLFEPPAWWPSENDPAAHAALQKGNSSCPNGMR